ncbi:hypothetical protein LZ32DRAFT_600890 [Colletotrichum eremochloae]|nr:hypothetical protein LZ32DRAFT_600890 [Colletotrichum eremochloae]
MWIVSLLLWPAHRPFFSQGLFISLYSSSHFVVMYSGMISSLIAVPSKQTATPAPARVSVGVAAL